MDYEIIILTFFIANALFWGLFPHNAHCMLVDNLNKLLNTKIQCPTHTVHLLMGVGFYIGSIYFAQKDVPEFKKLMSRLFK